MAILERRINSASRPIQYVEFGGPFFNPEEIEKIRQGGKDVDFFGFLSAHGLDVKRSKRRTVSRIIRARLGIPTLLRWEKESKTAIFEGKDIDLIESALSDARFDILPYFEGGIENFNVAGQFLGQINT